MPQAIFGRLGSKLLVLAILIAGGLAIFALSPRQARYQGKPLTDWLDDLTAESMPHPATVTSEMLAARRESAVAAIRQMGTNTLAQLISFLSVSANPSFARKQLENVLQKQSLIKLPFPIIPDRRQQAIEAFRVLGPAGKPAIGKLAELLQSGTNYWSVECLKAIGPQSVAALIKAMDSTKLEVVSIAIVTLGEFGTASSEAVPRIAGFASGTNDRLASSALQVLSEIDPNPSRFVPLFEARLNNTNLVPAATFALGRVGAAGIPPLVRAIVRGELATRMAAVAALAPEVRNTRREQYPTNYSLQGVVCLFNSRMLSSAWLRYKSRDESCIVVPALTGVLGHPDPAVRMQIFELFAHYGAAGVSGLSHGASDEIPEVRQKTADLIRGLGFQIQEGAIVRGPTREKKLYLLFCGHEFAEGAATILDELKKHKAKASFFLTSDFLMNTNFSTLIHRVVEGGHYLGAYSGKHLLYSAWQSPEKNRVMRGEFVADLVNNRNRIEGLSIPEHEIQLLLAPNEHHSQEIADCSKMVGFTVVNFTPALLSAADYTAEAESNFVSSKVIFDGIVTKEQKDPNALNGCLLLLHIGSGPRRADKFHLYFGELLDHLAEKGYEFVRVDELLERK